MNAINEHHVNSLQQSKDELQHFLQVKEKLKKKIEKAIDTYIYYFINEEVQNVRTTAQPELVKKLIEIDYPERFTANTETISINGGWDGVYEYNYGNALTDTKNGETCIVAKETNCYVWLCCPDNVTNNALAFKVLKNRVRYQVLRRCIIDLE